MYDSSRPSALCLVLRDVAPPPICAAGGRDSPTAEIVSWRTRDGEPLSPSPELRAYVEQQAERPARVAFWVPDAELGPMVLLLPEVGARTPPQAVEIPLELAEG